MPRNTGLGVGGGTTSLLSDWLPLKLFFREQPEILTLRAPASLLLTLPPTIMARFSARLDSTVLFLFASYFCRRLRGIYKGRSSALTASTWTADTQLSTLFFLNLAKMPGICQSPAPGCQPGGQLLPAKWRNWWQVVQGKVRNQLVMRILWTRGQLPGSVLAVSRINTAGHIKTLTPDCHSENIWKVSFSF